MVVELQYVLGGLLTDLQPLEPQLETAEMLSHEVSEKKTSLGI